MPCSIPAMRGYFANRLMLVSALAILVPIAAQANSSSLKPAGNPTCLSGAVCVYNGGGMATGGASGLVMDGTAGSMASTVGEVDLGGPVYTTKTGLTGTLSLTTGALTSGSLQNGGTFADGTLTITVQNAGSFSGVLFTGTFGSAATGNPIVWVLTGHKNGKYDYELIGFLSGTFEGNGQVTGQTAQLYFESATKYNGGAINLSNGSTTLVTPEPASLGLMGTGLFGLGLMLKRKAKTQGFSTL